MAVTMWARLDVTVTASADEEAHAHGLGVIPTFVFLMHGSHADITLGSTAPDADSVYLDNANVGDQDAILLVFTPHSLING